MNLQGFLNSSERRTWRFLWERFERGQPSPSQQEIAKAIFVSRPTVGRCLRVLEAKGLIELNWLDEERLAARSVVLVRPAAGEVWERPFDPADRDLGEVVVRNPIVRSRFS